MSGIANDAVTMPGRLATFATWSRDPSEDRLGSRAGEANTTPGTRIDPVGAIRYR